ncbi:MULTISPECIES: hypothetical protein [unclassified Paraburkholderia]|uniref:hypothetical protein n=1 Tax=unclassified Paraburkholderia TaxID=2615204 RepID=UPI00160A414B|nr:MULTISPECIES: hypothetical protein [unclassified Paraburkholderia]MBB5448230.1 hypothetical protein [Paraburkholderia sp. WSM4177]MBB5488595.1 hypothetical protein [Paraburkholderia sp. WSM4180]
MGYYGIADFAGGFNKVRDDSLTSGLSAANKMRDRYLADYQMPEKMTASDANATANSIRYDTLNTGYNDMVQHGVNNASFNAQQSGVNLDKLVAEQSIQKLRAQAAQQGMTNPADIARYVFSNLPPEQVAANPYLTNAALEQQRAAGQVQANLGGALGGTLGAGMTTQGLNDAGYGITASTDENGNLIYTDANGSRSTPFSRGGQIPAAVAFGGNVDPMAAYYGNLDAMAAQSQWRNDQLAQRDRYDQLRYGNSGSGGAGNVRILQAQLTSLQRLYTSQKGNPVEQAKTLQRINQVLGQLQGQPAGAPAGTGTSGMNAMYSTAPVATASNPFGYPDETASPAPSLPPAASVPPVSPVVSGTTAAAPTAAPLTMRQLQAAAEAPQPVYLNALRGAGQLPVISDAAQRVPSAPGGLTANDLALLKLLRGS